MKRLAIDTNAYMAYCYDDSRVTDIIARAGRIGIPVAVIGEIHFGAYRSQRVTKNLRNIQRFIANPRVEILHIDEHTAKIFGEISTELANIGRPIQQNDIWIASLAKQYDFPLLTADKGFEHIIGLEVIGF